MTNNFVKSYSFLAKEKVFLIPLNEIETPIRNPGIAGYRSHSNYLRIRNSMVNHVLLEPIEVRSREKSNTLKYVIYDGFHRAVSTLKCNTEPIR